jgi:mono/diheme cytochrome c family protein
MKRLLVLVTLLTVAGCIVSLERPTPTYAALRHGASADSGEMWVGDTSDTAGAQVYAKRCAICHGEQKEGILPSFPPLQNIRRQMTTQQITDIIHTGKGRMPAFPRLPDADLTALLHYLVSSESSMSASETATGSAGTHPTDVVEAGGGLFQQSCAFCHGRDTMGGESGPDLTRSKLVSGDVGGDKISEVVRNGRPEKKMPAFNFSNQELLSLTAFIHSQQAKAASQKGSRRGVDVADLQTGHVAAGKRYFDGTGGCAKCHSASGDLAGIASRYEGLQLEERMLFPRDAKSQVVVTLPSGQPVKGTLAYRDEFTVGLLDSGGTYRSWPTDKVKYVVDERVNAHADLFEKYTDEDIHNLMAYIQTLR